MKFLTQKQVQQYVKHMRGKRTHAEFAAWLGVSKQAVGQYESGNALPGDRVLEKLKLTKAFEVLK